MKNSMISTEAVVLFILLLFGLLGAKAVLQSENDSPGLALPRQESPAMVLAPEESPGDYWWDGEHQ